MARVLDDGLVSSADLRADAAVMPRRLSRRYLEARLKVVAEALGWRAEPRWRLEGQMKANPFVVYIAHAPDGKFRVCMTLNEDGATTDLTGLHRAYTAAELDAWFSGILFCKATPAVMSDCADECRTVQVAKIR